MRNPFTLHENRNNFFSLSGDSDSEGEKEDDPVYDTATPAKNDFRYRGRLVSIAPTRRASIATLAAERVARCARSNEIASVIATWAS